jgi:predicted aldo/keto reductase-like oxidoreductase
MPMRMLGKTGMCVSVVGHGCAIQFKNLAEGAWQSSLDAALAGGINIFDFASEYGTEVRAGIYFTPSLRSKVYLTTKINARDYNGAKTEFESSLRLMKTDYVDILFCHALSTGENMDTIKNGVWKYMLECKTKQTARFIGFSSMASASMSKTFLTTAGVDPDVCILALNAAAKGTLYPPAAFIKDALPVANAANVGVCAMKVVRDMTGSMSAEDLMAYVLNMKDSTGKYAVATMFMGFTNGANEVTTDINLAKKICANLAGGCGTGVLQPVYNFEDIERRASRICTPETVCWMRPDYRDNGQEYIWA